MIQQGQRVYIRPEWQDSGDGDFVWTALEDEDGGRVLIGADLGLAINPTQVVLVSMLCN
jgi:hypothetical protein